MNSIVYRGVPHESFYSNLAEVRQWHSGEVILSTWEDVDVDESMLDKVVRSKDPGENEDIGNPSLRFADRQILAARQGILEASGEKILLTRSDIRHPKDLFSSIKVSEGISPYRVFSAPLVVGSIMSIDPDSGFGPERDRYFRMCDWFQWGYKKDLDKFTDVIEELNKNKHSGCCLEQLWFLSCFNKFNKLQFEISKIESHKDECWKTIMQNFKIINSVGFNTGKWNHKQEGGAYISEDKYKKLSNFFINLDTQKETP